MVSEEGAGGLFVGDRIHGNGERMPVRIKSLCGSQLAVVLLHVARLTIAFVARIIVGVARAIRVTAVGPLGIGALDGESAYPLVKLVLDGQRVGDVVAGGAHLRPDKHRLMKTLVLLRIYVLVG